MTSTLQQLSERIAAATGGDDRLDRAIAALLDPSGVGSMPSYTTSVPDCIALIGRLLPGWSWHVGHGPNGVLPYAFVRQGRQRHEASAPTVPLALLGALVKAMIADGSTKPPPG